MPPKLKNAQALAERRLQQRMCHRRRYNKIKNDPEILEIERIKRRQRYLRQKEAKKEISFHDQREQRKKWRENSKRYRQRKKEDDAEEENVKLFETVHIQALADLDHLEAEDANIKPDIPLPHCPQIQAEVMKVRCAELRKRKNLLRIIATLKEREKSQRKYIQKLKRKLMQMRAIFSPHEPQLGNDNSASEERESPIMERVINFYAEDTNSAACVSAGKKKIVTHNEDRKHKREEERKELKRKKTNARQRAYYQRQKDLKKNQEIIKTVPKSNAERQRKFRQHNAEKSYMDIVSKKKKQQRGWVFVGPAKDKPFKPAVLLSDVKEDPEWETDSDASQQVEKALTGDAEEAHLQMDIDIKQEIEVGPVQIQPQDIDIKQEIEVGPVQIQPQDIDIKQEIEVGPVQIQPQDIYYSYKNIKKENMKKC